MTLPGRFQDQAAAAAFVCGPIPGAVQFGQFYPEMLCHNPDFVGRVGALRDPTFCRAKAKSSGLEDSTRPTNPDQTQDFDKELLE